MERCSGMQASAMLLLLLHVSFNTVDEGQAVNPGCKCLRFTSTYGKQTGVFSSPDYPKPYPPHVDCLLYTFTAAPYEIVELVFNDFDIYKSHLNCVDGDHLKVYAEGSSRSGEAGVNEYSVWSRVLCGGRTDAPTALYSHGPALVLEFHTGPKKINATGFVGTYRFIDRRLFETDGIRSGGTECDYQFTSSPSKAAHGKLYSPRYPSSYPNNVRCDYRFQAKQNERIRLVFEEIALQKGDLSCLNRADILKVFDGRSTTAPVISMLCNEISGYEILSTGPDLLVQFTANSDWPGQGFKATFQFQPKEDSSGQEEPSFKTSIAESFNVLGPEVSATTSTCHQVLSSDQARNGTLTSPSYPSPYPPKTHCHYDFFARGKQRVHLLFHDFILQRSSDSTLECVNVDALQAYVYVEGRLEKMATFCGNQLPKPIMSNGPKLMLEFRGLSPTRHSRGFKLSYFFVEGLTIELGTHLDLTSFVAGVNNQDFGLTFGQQLIEYPCAFVLNSSESSNGTFWSPNYPGPYPRDTECIFFFHGTQDERVHLHFLHFDVEGVLPCEAVSASDYVEFSNFLLQDPKYSRYCGQLKPFHIQSDRNFFKLTFKANDRMDGTGFKANYHFLKPDQVYPIEVEETSSGSDVINRSLTLEGVILAELVLVFVLKCLDH